MAEHIKTIFCISHCNAEGQLQKDDRREMLKRAQGEVWIQEAIQPPGKNRTAVV